LTWVNRVSMEDGSFIAVGRHAADAVVRSTLRSSLAATLIVQA